MYVYRGGRECPVITEGWVKANKEEAHVQAILWDSGGLCDSLISKKLVDARREEWKDSIQETRQTLKLGDSETKKRVSESIEIELTVLDRELKQHTATLKALVWDMEDLDLIVGLDDCLSEFGDFYLELVKNGVADAKLKKETGLTASLQRDSELPPTDMKNGDIRQWSNSDDDGSPEADECPEPCSFTSALQFMEQSHEEALEKYYSQFEEHVHPEFLAYPGVKELLKSPMATGCFVPQDWKGLVDVGFGPLELDFMDTLPAEHPVRSRPINPRLFENTKKEFERLLKYFYVPSKSPWASPLVIAPKATAPFIRFCGDYTMAEQVCNLPKAIHTGCTARA